MDLSRTKEARLAGSHGSKWGKACWEPREQVVLTVHLTLLAPSSLGAQHPALGWTFSITHSGLCLKHLADEPSPLFPWHLAFISCPQLWTEQTGRISWHNLYQKQPDLSYPEPTTRANRTAPGQVCCTLTDEKGIISEEIQPCTMWTGDRSPLARGADYIPVLPWLTAPKKYIAIHTRENSMQ